MDTPTVAVTMGDPAGIGPEVVVAAYPDLLADARPVVVGDADVLRRAVDIVDSDLVVRAVETVADAPVEPDAGVLPVFDLDTVDADALAYGEVREAYGAAALAYVERAIDLATTGAVDAIATAPINKQATRLAGSEHAGHTGLLADATDTETYAMMLVEDDLRVTHVSTHVPLVEACERVTPGAVLDTIEVTVDGLRDLGIDDPTVAVAGLNPHASDGGLLGTTEQSEIRPAVRRACEAGYDVFGPESPDTVFARAAGGAADCVVAMYHDQGHIPIKMLGFASDDAVSGVNVTVGLPIVRTSVDHGTAFDIAGEGVASPASMVDAVELAARIARNRAAREGDEGGATDRSDADDPAPGIEER
ncbi:MAG: 4-hydroxythreonine-4-phosphate dehydrogenase PdxA [Haloarculaceae archaeon]